MRRATGRAARALVLAGVLVASPLAANGRFPRAQQLVVDPGDPAHLVLRTTYGFLTSSDAGQSWHWICEEAIGYSGTEDPAIGITLDGTLLAGIFAGLAVSHDGGCDFAFVGGSLKDRFVVDLSVQKDDPATAIALVSMGQGGGKFLNQVYASSDAGKTWAELGTPLDDQALGLTIDAAPADPQRLYVSGLLGEAGVLFRSSDRGQSWERLPIAGSDLDHAAYLGAVHPTDPDVLFVRLNGPSTADDVLLHSDDGGQSFTEVLRGQADLFGFALSPDGQTLLVGFGDSREPGSQVDDAVLGVWRAPTGSLAFERVFEGPINCLTWAGAGVYACTFQFYHGYEIGFSKDQGQSFEELMQLTDLEGPLECAAETTTGTLCPSRWDQVCANIGKCGLEDAGAGGGAGGAGSGGSPATGGSSGGEDGGSGGCGCRTPARGAGAALAGAALAGAALALAAARRWRGRRH